MIINLKSQTDLSGFYIVFNGSTNLEERGIYGISHFMEHLICKNFEHLRDDFEKYGIDWNAYTSQNEIVFYFTGLDKYLSPWKEKLVDLITDFRVSKEKFENERKIILQEYSNSFLDQTQCHTLNLSRKLFRNYESIGLKQDIETLKYMDCLNFFEKQFKRPTKIINVSTENPFRYDLDFMDTKVDKRYEMGPFKDVIIEPTRNYGDKVSLAMLSPIIESDFNYISFINNMLSLGLSSPFYTEIREKRGLVYYIRIGQSRMNSQSVNTIITQSDQSNSEQIFDTIKMIFDNPNKFLSRKRFELIKNSYKIKYHKDRINRYQNVNLWINPKGWSVKEILETVTYDKILDVFETNFKFDKFYKSIDKTEFI
jgi:predicted Zn-dependent peptidase